MENDKTEEAIGKVTDKIRGSAPIHKETLEQTLTKIAFEGLTHGSYDMFMGITYLAISILSVAPEQSMRKGFGSEAFGLVTVGFSYFSIIVFMAFSQVANGVAGFTRFYIENALFESYLTLFLILAFIHYGWILIRPRFYPNLRIHSNYQGTSWALATVQRLSAKIGLPIIGQVDYQLFVEPAIFIVIGILFRMFGFNFGTYCIVSGIALHIKGSLIQKAFKRSVTSIIDSEIMNQEYATALKKDQSGATQKGGNTMFSTATVNDIKRTFNHNNSDNEELLEMMKSQKLD